MTQKTMTKGILNQIIHNLVKNVTFLLKFIQLISKNWHLKIHYGNFYHALVTTSQM